MTSTHRSHTEDIDPTVPSVARMYDYALGGKNWFDIDRRVYEHFKTVVPHQDDVGLANRRWLERVVRYVTHAVGLNQVLDLGSGLPTQKNTHEVAQEFGNPATVVYADNDPACVARGRELLATNDATHFLDLDLTDPAAVWSHPELGRHLDLNRPLLLMQCGTLHHVDDGDEAAQIMHDYVRRLPAGSYVMISHFFDPGDEDEQLHRLARRAEQALHDEGLGTGRWRTRAEIGALFDGLTMVEPGLVTPDRWWPSGPPVRDPWPDELLLIGGLGRKC